jgi:hypothetical protein
MKRVEIIMQVMFDFDSKKSNDKFPEIATVDVK